MITFKHNLVVIVTKPTHPFYRRVFVVSSVRHRDGSGYCLLQEENSAKVLLQPSDCALFAPTYEDGQELFKFPTADDYDKHALLRYRQKGVTMASTRGVDAKGRPCKGPGDLERAKRDGAFPVVISYKAPHA